MKSNNPIQQARKFAAGAAFAVSASLGAVLASGSSALAAPEGAVPAPSQQTSNPPPSSTAQATQPETGETARDETPETDQAKSEEAAPGGADSDDGAMETTPDDAPEDGADAVDSADAADGGGAGDETARLAGLADAGDKDAALVLARLHVEGDQPDYEAAAKYAMIAIADGGAKSIAAFIPDTKAWPRDFWRSLQTELQSSGAYRGAIDGLPGRGTQSALMAHAGIEAPVATKRSRTTTKPRRKIRRGSHSN